MAPRSPQLAREKLLHAVVYFVKNTRNCNKIKLFKLLYFLDFELFRQTGKSVTGLEYYAWPMGPVPRVLFEEMARPAPDMQSVLSLRVTSELDPDFKDKRVHIAARKAFDQSIFTERELEEMKRLAEIFSDATAQQMIEVTHLKRQPWHQVYVVEDRRQQEIPYTLALDDTKADSITKEQADLVAEEERITRALFG